ncbi:M4 family metallopeptidase [Streptomyces morookaense]|uniref:M4 family metallopeptidase n=1 Tax=Streptomyces morookaense TaxID=1970 RepID=UPI0033CE19B0
MRQPRARAGRRRAGRTPQGISGAAALISAAALVVPAVPAHAAAGPAGSSPGEVIPGRNTATPALVTGIREQARATGSAADAARGHLAGKESRYRIADPARDLDPLRTTTTGTTEVVRLQQRHRGVEVLGGQYVVRMEHKDGKRVVTGTSGKYFTGLTAGTEPQVDQELAVERAVEATEAQLGGARPGKTEPALTGTARGLVVLPKGPGVLTQHVTVRGTAPGTGEPVLREVFVDARAGYPVLQYSGIKTFAPPAPGPAPAGAAAAHTALTAEPPASDTGVQGSGVKLDGTTADLQLARDTAHNTYVMRDYSRMRDTTKNVLATWDAHTQYAGDVSGHWPDGIKEFASPAPAFGKDATDAGAVDAHWAAGKVYDYYRTVHGRNSLDGRGMTINSLVGVSNYGMPYVNAFWDGTKMVYGNGDSEYRPLSAGLDVVGHEMTHGVVENSANLVYAGQSGALNEALADYFGTALKDDTYHIPMDSPDSGLVGDTLCRTKAPRDCAIRDLNDGRTTSGSFTGVGFGTDNGGVHLNSTIFSGALWNIRRDLGPALADRIVYRALTAYMTPLDGFTEGRNAVIAAAKDLKIADGDLKSVQRDFNAHGIVPDWELALGVDSDQLLGRVNTTDTSVGAGGGWWTASQSNDDGSEAYSVWAGRTDGSGAPKLISPNDGRYHVTPVTDGKTVVWQAYKGWNVDILARPLAGGPIKTLYSGRYRVSSLHVEGKTVVFQITLRHVGQRVVYLKMGETDPTEILPGGGPGRGPSTELPSLADGRIAFTDWHRENRKWRTDMEVLDTATGKRTVVQQLRPEQEVVQTALTGKHIFWLSKDHWPSGVTALRRVDLDGSGAVDISPDTGKDALQGTGLSATGDAVTVTARPADAQDRNGALSKLWQFSTDGSRRGRVSCNRGEQLWGTADSGTRVVWLDATTGYTDLVTRSRPAGRCG